MADEESCNLTCDGNKSEICGSVYYYPANVYTFMEGKVSNCIEEKI
jgi:hypothetical protein